jgi:ribosome-binding protein aMBF1 (putative translation factor)
MPTANKRGRPLAEPGSSTHERLLPAVGPSRQVEVNAEVARSIHDLRAAAGLTQKELADLVGTTASVICRLEDARYEGHSVAMLRRVASALNRRLEIRFVEVSADRDGGQPSKKPR